MNILSFSWRDPKHPQAGGAEQVMHEHMKGWVAAGHEVTLFSSNFKGARSTEVVDGVKVLRRGRQLLGVQISALFWYIFGSNKEFDLVVDQFHGIPFFTSLYIRKPIIGVVQEVAGKVWLQNDLPKPINYIVGMIGYLLEPLFFRFYRRTTLITGSNSAKEDLVKIGIPKKNINIIPHGVIIKKPKPFPKKEKKQTIIYLGALTKDKGIEDAIEAFDLIAKDIDCQFWIVGKGRDSYVYYLKEKIERMGLSSKVKFWGFVSQERKFELLARAHIMINPSVLEGFGLVNIESNSMGTPVVAYKSRGLVDSVVEDKSGVFCEENTPLEMADRVSNLLMDNKRLKSLSQSSVEWSKKFEWKRSRAMSLGLLRDIIDNRV